MKQWITALHYIKGHFCLFNINSKPGLKMVQSETELKQISRKFSETKLHVTASYRMVLHTSNNCHTFLQQLSSHFCLFHSLVIFMAKCTCLNYLLIDGIHRIFMRELCKCKFVGKSIKCVFASKRTPKTNRQPILEKKCTIVILYLWTQLPVDIVILMFPMLAARMDRPLRICARIVNIAHVQHRQA